MRKQKTFCGENCVILATSWIQDMEEVFTVNNVNFNIYRSKSWTRLDRCKVKVSFK